MFPPLFFVEVIFMTWELALMGLLVFCGQVVVLTLGTVRMVVTVQGETRVAFFLAMLEMLLWVLGTSAVLARVAEAPFLGVCYALGFATGTVSGIMAERRLAFGNVVVRIISAGKGAEIGALLRGRGYAITTVAGEGGEGPVTVQFVVCRRRDMPHVLQTAMAVDADIFHTVESVSGVRRAPGPVRATEAGASRRSFLRRFRRAASRGIALSALAPGAGPTATDGFAAKNPLANPLRKEEKGKIEEPFSR